MILQKGKCISPGTHENEMINWYVQISVQMEPF